MVASALSFFGACFQKDFSFLSHEFCFMVDLLFDSFPFSCPIVGGNVGNMVDLPCRFRNGGEVI